MGAAPMGLAALCVAAGALFGVVPFLLEYRVMARVAEAAGLTTVVSQVQKLEELATEIRHATGQWQAVEEQADKTAAAARSIAERMTAEVKSFSEFMERANDTEKAHLRLEAEKLHRAEGEWLSILVRVLDHIYALYQAGLRSRQPSLVEQLTHFQNACLDAARRVGLAPFSAAPDEAFDTQRHQAAESNGKPPDGAVVSQTLATGYTFQGRFLRPALVRLRGEVSPQSTVQSPQSTDHSPESTVHSPESKDHSAESTDQSPKSTDQSPQLGDGSPEVEGAGSANGGDRQEPPPEPAEPKPPAE